MAEGRIKGITIEIDGDVTGLNKALESTNKELRSSQKQLNDVNRLLKIDPTNTELLTQKQRLLGDTIKSTRDKLDTLKKAQEQATAKLETGGKEAQEQYEALRREIISTENYLGKLEGQAEDTEKALNDAGNNGAGSIEEAGDAAKDAESKVSGFGSAAKAAGVVAAAAFAAATAAAVSLGKDVIESYGEYEQLVGGIDTLFKDSSAMMQEYANNAYKTAGMSANDYMSTATSFSASLIQSLGGDTEAAVKYADMAITDMADNANKMGTDIGLIQNAYQGFAKQNYTMLDNLKLGYGGTKEEMERLLADATAISGIEYDISSYADVVDAIHAIQESMGVAGATAAEAEHTIEGSMNSMKAAVANLVVGFGNADADIEQLCNNVVDAFQDVLTNITPIIENIIAALPTALNALLETVVELLPTLLEIGGEIVFSIADGIIDNIPQIVKAGEKLIGRLASGIFKSIPDLIKMLGSIISEMKETAVIAGGLIIALKGFKIVDSLSKSVKGFTGIFSGLNAAMNANPIGAIVSAVGALIAVFGLLASATEDVCEPVYKLSEAEEAVIENARDAKKSYDDLKKTFRSDVDAIMEETKRVEGLWGELQTLADKNGNVEEANRNRANYILGELSTATGEEWQMIDGTIQRYDDLTNSIEATIKAKKAEKLVEAGEESYDTAKANYDESLDALEFMDNQVRAQRAQLESYNQALAEFESEHAQELRGVDYNLADLYAIDPSLALAWEDLTDKVTDTENVLIGLEAEYEEANKTTAKYYEDIYYYEQAQEALLSGNYDEAIELMTRDTAYRWKNLAEKRKITKEELFDLKKDYESALFVAENYRKNYEAGMVGYTADGLHEAESAAAELGRIWAEAARDAEVSGRNIAKGLARGMKDSVTDVDNAAGYVANTALSKIKNVAQIASPSKVTTSYGEYIDDGLIVGLKLKMHDVSQAASQIADAVLGPVESGLDLSGNVGSPAAWYVPAQQQSSTVYNNSTSLGGITVYVDAKNVDNVEDLAELVADKINTDIINRQAVSK